MTTNGDMALQDRIRTVMTDMGGRDYGKRSRLAEIAGCTRAVVTHWLSGGQTDINYEHAKNIAEHFGYRLEWVMEGKGPKKEGEQPQLSVVQGQPGEELILMKLTVEELKIIAHYRASDEIGRRMIEITAAGAPKITGEEH